MSLGNADFRQLIPLLHPRTRVQDMDVLKAWYAAVAEISITQGHTGFLGQALCPRRVAEGSPRNWLRASPGLHTPHPYTKIDGITYHQSSHLEPINI